MAVTAEPDPPPLPTEPPVEFVFEAELLAECETFVRSAAQRLWATFAFLFADRGLALPALRLIVADDLMAAASRQYAEFGLGPDRREGVERLGGIAVGKTIRNDGGDYAAVIIAADVANHPNGIAQYCCAGMIGHEFGHVLYGTARDAAIGATDDVSMPWDVAGMIAVVAAEEYRVDRLSQLLVERALPATDDDGNPVTLAALNGTFYLDGLADALDTVVPGLPDTVNRYRAYDMALEDMWRHVAYVSEHITLFCAHADAFHDSAFYDGAPLFEALPEHPGRELLASVWLPLAEHLHGSPLLPDAENWSEDRTQIDAAGRDGWARAWQRLGLCATLNGDTFHLAVTAPQV